MCADTGTLPLQTAAGMSMNLSASHLCPASAPIPPAPTPPQINDCLSSFVPNHDQDAEAIENVYSSCKKRKRKKKGRNASPCSTKWTVFTLMGLLIRVTLFMCVLNWRWAQAVILEGDQPCLGLLNLMENLPTAFALSPTDWKQNNLAFRLLSCFDCQIQYITFTDNTQPSHWFLPSAEFITFTVGRSSWTCTDWGGIAADCYLVRLFISFLWFS